jgi:hypothetical protein
MDVHLAFDERRVNIGGREIIRLAGGRIGEPLVRLRWEADRKVTDMYGRVEANF